ncbi:hypothetical protein HDU76_001975, partial [Blyttiomyces sp. JEL0837]
MSSKPISATAGMRISQQHCLSSSTKTPSSTANNNNDSQTDPDPTKLMEDDPHSPALKLEKTEQLQPEDISRYWGATKELFDPEFVHQVKPEEPGTVVVETATTSSSSSSSGNAMATRKSGSTPLTEFGAVKRKYVGAPKCPGCGAPFQHTKPSNPGYLPPNFRSQKPPESVHSISKLPSILSKAIPEDALSIEKDALTPSELKKLLKTRQKELLRKEGGGLAAGYRPPSLIAESSKSLNVDQDEVVTCQYCHKLRHFNQYGSTPEDQSRLKNQRKRYAEDPDLQASKAEVYTPGALESLNNVVQSTNPQTFEDLFGAIRIRSSKSTVIVNVIDSLDLPGSLVRDLTRFVGSDKPILIVANKIDALPRHVVLSKLKKWLYDECKRMLGDPNEGAGWELILASAKSGDGLLEIVDGVKRLGKWEGDHGEMGDVVLVGRPNVGKSKFIKALFKMTGRDGDVSSKLHPTVSLYPGTTIGVIGIPLTTFGGLFVPSSLKVKEDDTRNHNLTYNLYDTPGIFSGQQLTSLLNHEEMRIAVPSNSLASKKYKIAPGRCMYIGGLARIDMTGGNSTTFARVRTHFNHALPIHMCRDNKKWSLYGLHLGTNTQIMFPPIGKQRALNFPKLKAVKKLVFYKPVLGESEAVDIAFGGLGWVTLDYVPRGVEITVLSAGGVGVSVRPSFMDLKKKMVVKSGDDEEIDDDEEVNDDEEELDGRKI